MTATDPKRLDFLDALRGVAILLVIAVRASQSIDNLPRQINAMAEQGSRGVQLFIAPISLRMRGPTQASHAYYAEHCRRRRRG
ncbi:hypothetical protein [Bradyrhizobium sp. WD16]|uniref:hypothetical protein n=1 Tax=Bradyrhizobium sp. WD16 TaxID=1521768 RepID=UPI0020A4B4A6|nr:hypothetical protein [Bradyrhizobium sp. WD16]UTD25705.1 hypothetical protein DB459_01035 [Bradyrhizobium sp. WD16]